MKYKPSIMVLKGFMENYNPYDEELLKMEDELLKEFGRRLCQQRNRKRE
jgi:hypothetical protein